MILKKKIIKGNVRLSDLQISSHLQHALILTLFRLSNTPIDEWDIVMVFAIENKTNSVFYKKKLVFQGTYA